jgi:hypothetical protein
MALRKKRSSKGKGKSGGKRVGMVARKAKVSKRRPALRTARRGRYAKK